MPSGMASRVKGHSRLFDVDIEIEIEYTTFGSLGRDTTGDFVPSPDIDLETIAATLAAGPGPQCYYTGAAHPGPSRMRSVSPRKMRPHRLEHVKRSRISYDAFGGQEPKIPLSAVLFSATASHQQPLANSNKTTKERDGQNVAPGHDFFSRLFKIMGMIILQIIFGKGSHV